MEKTNGGEATVEIDTEKLGLELMEEDIYSEGTRTEEQGHSIEDGLGSSTQQRYRCSGICLVRT